SLKTSIKTITNLSDTNCLEIQGASLLTLGFVGFLSMSSMMDTAQTGCFLKKSTLMKKQEYGKRKNTL
ncbi:hypothetical protein ACTZN5_08935, partial [Klebsiella pneumoniae]